MTADERKRMLAAIFDRVTGERRGSGPAGTLRGLEALRTAAIRKPVVVREGPSERKTGLEPATSTRELSLNATGRVQVERARPPAPASQ
jgi:hypothetical protein